jgi:hypothetical protein
MGSDDPMRSEFGDPSEPPTEELVDTVAQALERRPHVRVAKLRCRTHRGGALDGVEQLELALLFDEPLLAPTDQAKETISDLSARLRRSRIRPTVTGVGGVAVFHRYGAVVYARRS